MVPLESFLPDSITEENFDRFPYLLSRPKIEPLHREDGSFELERALVCKSHLRLTTYYILLAKPRGFLKHFYVGFTQNLIESDRTGIKPVHKEKREALKFADIYADGQLTVRLNLRATEMKVKRYYWQMPICLKLTVGVHTIHRKLFSI